MSVSPPCDKPCEKRSPASPKPSMPKRNLISPDYSKGSASRGPSTSRNYIGYTASLHPEKEFTMPTTTDKLIIRKEGGIGWVIFNNPAKRNAMSMDMYLAMGDAFEDYSRDPAVRVVILKGAGDKSFVSGADISEFKERRATAEAKAEYEAASDRASKALRECPKPTIAMIRGFCMG